MPGSRLLVNRVGIMEPMDGECKRQWLLCISNVTTVIKCGSVLYSVVYKETRIA